MTTISTSDLRILVIDDEETVRESYRLILQDPAATSARTKLHAMRARLFRTAGTDGATPAPVVDNRFDVTYCASAVEGVAAIREALASERPYAVAFIDMRMPPGQNGVWAAERIRALDCEIEIVVCTAYSDIDPADIALRVQPEDKLFYLEKPLRTHDVRLIARALTQKWQAERRIARLAYFDGLTGLPNRTHFHQQLSSALRTAAAKGEQLAILYLDLDNFKRINDTLGHGMGDKLLRETADRLRAVCREDDPIGLSIQIDSPRASVARLGGDEFVICLRNIASPDDACTVAQRVIRAMNQVLRLADHEILVTTSLGIALFPIDGADVEALCRHADLAMYFAKRQGPGQIALYTETMNSNGLKRLTLEEHLRHALSRSELSLHYQPQINLSTGVISGFEALMRWNSAELGLVPPDDFIPVAEETGLIIPMGEWAMRTACTQLKQWLQQGLAPGRVAVNVSSMQFAQHDFPERVAQILRETGLPPQSLEIEVTESLVMQEESSTEQAFASLKQLGVTIAVDDFGKGYSNFERLRQRSVHRLKIDRSFVNRLHRNVDDRALVSAMIKMAQTLSMDIVAEGVDEFGQLLYLKDEGCNQAQGFLLGVPMPGVDVSALLKRVAEAPDAGRTARLRRLTG